MKSSPERLLSIAEASAELGVPAYVLRQWEAKFPPLRPGRDPAGRRRYAARDMSILRRIKQLVRHERLTLEGARIRLAQELYGEGRPRTRQEMVDLADHMEAEVRALLDLLDQD
ncbi:MAG: MerR family transcriptional regulator [Candidatus Hydrogenedentes bacterium]|nr:MerR family transcriptional regulator [Candidatus Hydrogenedentota bacterium]